MAVRVMRPLSSLLRCLVDLPFSYGYMDDRIRRRCRLHKLPGMIDVKSPKCETPMCPKQPCCGHLGAKARFCSEHKQEGMVNLKVFCMLEGAVWHRVGLAGVLYDRVHGAILVRSGAVR